MSRRAKQFNKEVTPDSRYGSDLVTRLINRIMRGGKKSIATRIVYDSLENLSTKVNESPLEAFQKVVKNVAPVMEVRSRRVGGSTYQVPMEVKTDRALSLALRWIVASARSRSGKTMIDKLAGELIDAHHNNGASVKKREDTHKMAEANKAFAHFRW
jgi:small subunit ribosomal protein S7